ncbi:DUF4345 domain-containing protein [Sphingomonas sp. AOB5]|uniref:DUF4345 domain-containing protein n=1 Tax=Sphingomonas sp. AOB5 TaxID=3034017 RepID=UPI0023F9AEF5|nr:DUF4345 domain-containing protein [Sphingomonas sp. AOB5]MDF7777430.1 DUF4345 domain-containing protein [Sphingomonas sp. AOB5]
MTGATERRLLQIVASLAALIPIAAASTGILRGASWLTHAPVPPDLDSHFRYLSGIFLGVGIAFATCIPDIEHKGSRFRLLGALVITGGLARALSLATIGPPSTGHLAGLCVELLVMPLLLFWQSRVERTAHATKPRSP